tara:strand:- start:639 stop:1139 length:501 start_codon:yes stop_codon:yes gene_type:complete
MIDKNELKLGDELTLYENGKHINTLIFISKFYDGFVAKDSYGNIEEWSYKYLKATTYWKRDGVNLLKQEEEKPLYVFCPIEKTKEGLFHADLTKMGCDDCIHVARLELIGAVEDYTFIGYSNSDKNPKPLVSKSPLDYCFRDDLPKVAKYAVFICTDKLEVGSVKL